MTRCPECNAVLNELKNLWWCVECREILWKIEWDKRGEELVKRGRADD